MLFCVFSEAFKLFCKFFCHLFSDEMVIIIWSILQICRNLFMVFYILSYSFYLLRLCICLCNYSYLVLYSVLCQYQHKIHFFKFGRFLVCRMIVSVYVLVLASLVFLWLNIFVACFLTSLIKFAQFSSL